MARIRTIKPEFFTSEDIVELTPLARLFYVALWCEADREGRLKWQKMTLKMRYLPADDCSIDDLSKELENAGLVIPYEVDGKQYAYIPGFKHHQVINNRESESIIPAHSFDASTTRESGVQAEGKEGRERKGKEGKGSENTSGNGDAVPACPHDDIIGLYHELLPACPRVRVWTDKRKKMLKARWREDSKRQSLEWWRKYFDFVASCDFLVGKTGGERPFLADLEWLINPSNMVKVIEGKYQNAQ